MIIKISDYSISLDDKSSQLIKNYFNVDKFSELTLASHTRNKRLYVARGSKRVYLDQIIVNNFKRSSLNLIKYKDGNTLNLASNNIHMDKAPPKTIKSDQDLQATLKPPSGVKIVSVHAGHIASFGVGANVEKNRYWLIKDKEDLLEAEYYMMSTYQGEYFKFSKKSLDKILKIENKDHPTWCVGTNGYVFTHIKTTCRTLHQHLMDHHGNGKGQISVDHINGDKLDNRLCNLRLATQKQQNQNKSKVITKNNLPSNSPISKMDIPKFIHFTKARGNHGEYFGVEIKELGFRNQTSKAKQYTLIEKLIQAIKIRAKAIKTNLTQYPNFFKEHQIEGKTYPDFKEFWDDQIKLLNDLAQKENLTEDFTKFDRGQFENDTNRVNLDFPASEKTQLTKKNLPKYVSYTPAKGSRGSSLRYDRKDPQAKSRTRFQTTTSQSVSLDDKLKEILNKMKENNVTPEYNSKTT